MRSWVWVKIVAWHASAGGNQTLCGRSVSGPVERSDELPAGKSCESCLRIVARREDT